MTKEQIEDIIRDLEKRKYEVVLKTYTGNFVSFYCNKHAFTIDYNGAKPVVGVGICLDVYSKRCRLVKFYYGPLGNI